jgi:hypothetical protein
VIWEAGEITAVAYRNRRPAVSETKRTAGAPVALRLTSLAGPRGLLETSLEIRARDLRLHILLDK